MYIALCTKIHSIAKSIFFYSVCETDYFTYLSDVSKGVGSLIGWQVWRPTMGQQLLREKNHKAKMFPFSCMS